MARNTWWVTRPKRSLPPVPRCLMAIAPEAEGKVWKTTDKTTELTIEKNLGLPVLKRRENVEIRLVAGPARIEPG